MTQDQCTWFTQSLGYIHKTCHSRWHLLKSRVTIRNFHVATDSLAESIYKSIHFFHEAMRGIFKSFNKILEYYPTSTSLPPMEAYHLWVSMIQIVSYSFIKVYLLSTCWKWLLKHYMKNLWYFPPKGLGFSFDIKAIVILKSIHV